MGSTAIRKALSTHESETPLMGKEQDALSSAGASDNAEDGGKTLTKTEKDPKEEPSLLVV